MTKRTKTIYRIFFATRDKAYEIYARKVTQSDLYGFIEIEEIVFGEKSAIVVDPSEESLKNEFGNVQRMLVPFHAITRIDTVEKEGSGKVFSISAHSGSSQAQEPLMPPQGPKKT
ncbi:MAG: DUF1820 family protein [Deltaproteobacteria bacterium]|jgi:hypothetical protein|nr:DUF1820 family protein [Deltaproteobacteria bacterium]